LASGKGQSGCKAQFSLYTRRLQPVAEKIVEKVLGVIADEKRKHIFGVVAGISAILIDLKDVSLW